MNNSFLLIRTFGCHIETNYFINSIRRGHFLRSTTSLLKMSVKILDTVRTIPGSRVRSPMGRVHHPREQFRGAGAVRSVRGRARCPCHDAALPARVQRARALPRRARAPPHAADHLRTVRRTDTGAGRAATARQCRRSV